MDRFGRRTAERKRRAPGQGTLRRLNCEASVFACRARPFSAVAAGGLGIHFRVYAEMNGRRERIAKTRLRPVFVFAALRSGLRPAQKALSCLLSNLQLGIGRENWSERGFEPPAPTSRKRGAISKPLIMLDRPAAISARNGTGSHHFPRQGPRQIWTLHYYPSTLLAKRQDPPAQPAPRNPMSVFKFLQA